MSRYRLMFVLDGTQFCMELLINTGSDIGYLHTKLALALGALPMTYEYIGE